MNNLQAIPQDKTPYLIIFSVPIVIAPLISLYLFKLGKKYHGNQSTPLSGDASALEKLIIGDDHIKYHLFLQGASFDVAGWVSTKMNDLEKSASGQWQYLLYILASTERWDDARRLLETVVKSAQDHINNSSASEAAAAAKDTLEQTASLQKPVESHDIDALRRDPLYLDHNKTCSRRDNILALAFIAGVVPISIMAFSVIFLS